MTTDEFRHLLRQVRVLHLDEQRRLLHELTQLVRHASEPGGDRPRRSIVELDGLGKSIWERVDPDRYIEEERRGWDG